MTQKVIISEVQVCTENYVVRYGDIGVLLKKKYGVVPKVGDELTIYTLGDCILGGLVRGLTINKKRIFFKTDAQMESYKSKWANKN